MTLIVDCWNADGQAFSVACANVSYGEGTTWADLSIELTEREREYAAARLPRLDRAAGRVAAKRALIAARSALALPGDDVLVEVLATAAGPPSVCWRGAPLPSRGQATLSVSHDGKIAVALAILTLPLLVDQRSA